MLSLLTDEAARLRALRDCDILEAGPQPELDALTRLAARVCDTPIALLSFVDESCEIIKSKFGWDSSAIPRQVGFGAHSILQPDLLVIANTRADERFSASPLVTADPRAAFYAGAPIVISPGYALGALCVMDRVARNLRPEQQESLKALACLAAGYIARHRDDISISRTITQLKTAEAEGLRERHFLYTFFDYLPDGIYFKDANSRFTRINKAQADHLGLKDPGHAVGKSDFDFFAPVHAEEAYVDEQEVIRTGQPLLDKEEREVLPDGRVRWVTTTKMPLRGPAGPIIGTFGISHDITERKLAEEALRQSEERLRLLFATIPQPVWVYDAATLKFLEINNTAVTHYGYSRQEFLQMTVLEILPAEEAEPARRALRTGSFATQTGAAWKHRTKDGNTIDVEISSHPITLDDRNGVLVVAQDVTKRKHLEIELRHAQKLEAVGQLAAGIAHEINTPIQFVGDNTRFAQQSFDDLSKLLDKYQKLYDAAAAGSVTAALLGEVSETAKTADLDYLREEIPKSLNQTLDGVERVATLVRAMKDFAHPDQGEKTAADLNKALTSTLIVARNELKYVADVETDWGELPSVTCYPGDLNQVFLNLLVNAAHAVGDAVRGTTRKGTIRVKTRQEGDSVMIAVSDTGTGIPASIRDRIFDPFFTTKEVGKGTGQGLAIARKIVVEKHGGTLSFETESGRGTTFFVRLPVKGSRVTAGTAPR